MSSIEPLYDLSKGIVGMAIKNVEISDSLFIKEWASDAAMESSVNISAGR